MFDRLIARFLLWAVRRRDWELVDRDKYRLAHRELVLLRRYVDQSGALRNEASVPTRVLKKLTRQTDYLIEQMHLMCDAPLDAAGKTREQLDRRVGLNRYQRTLNVDWEPQPVFSEGRQWPNRIRDARFAAPDVEGVATP